MADIAILSARAVEAVDQLSQRVSEKHWSDFGRTGFVYNTTRTINALEDLAALFEEMESACRTEGFGEKIKITNHLSEINSLIRLLGRNKSLEATKIQKARERGIELLAENVIAPDLYSSLEQKVLGLTLKSRFLIEHVNVFLRKEKTAPFIGSKSTKDVLELLNEKESEMQKLREKFEKIKNSQTLARLATDTPSDIEREVNDYSIKLSHHSKLLTMAFELNKKKIVELELSSKHLEEKIGLFDELQEKHFEKTLDLITLLKKERDYAKKLVLEIEGETLALRNTYSQKLLGLEEEKAREKSSAFEHFRKKILKQESDLKDKTELLEALRNTLHSKEKKIKKLEKQVKSAMKKKSKKSS